jgi:hypothetical protein
VSENKRGIQFVEAGFYRDSVSRLAKIAGMGYQFVRRALACSAAGWCVQSDTYNGGTPVIAPLPIAYDLGRAKLNAVFAPHHGTYDPFATLGFYFTCR